MPQARKAKTVASKPSKSGQVIDKSISESPNNTNQESVDARQPRRSTRIRSLQETAARLSKPEEAAHISSEGTSAARRKGTVKQATNLRRRKKSNLQSQPVGVPVPTSNNAIPNYRQSGGQSKVSKRSRGIVASQQSDIGLDSIGNPGRKQYKHGKARRANDTREEVTRSTPVPATTISSKRKVRSKANVKLTAPLVETGRELQTEKPRETLLQGYPVSSQQNEALSVEALERIDRILATVEASETQQPAFAADRPGYWDLSSPLANRYSDESSGDTSTETSDSDPEEEFNRKWGYLPPFDREAARVIAAIIENPSLAKSFARMGADSTGFREGLADRNVEVLETKIHDSLENIDHFEIPQDFLCETIEQKRCYEHLWQLDKVKCTEQPSQAIFQRTLMISLILRHCFLYEENESEKQILDFSVEEPWTCPPMPTRAFWKYYQDDTGAKILTQPKPDLAVCFKKGSIFSKALWKCLPTATKRLACFESDITGPYRVFHFLSIEAKNAMLNIEDTTALHQSLNNASQALFNMYSFFHDADPGGDDEFFEKVRFYSIVANNKGLLIRVHRATKLPSSVDKGELVIQNRRDYPLQYDYREVLCITDRRKYNRQTLMEVWRKIMYYGIHHLHPLLQAAAEKLHRKFLGNTSMIRERNKLSYYRFGQPAPKSRSRKTSITPSQNERTTPMNDRLESLQVNSSIASPYVDQQTEDGQATPRAGSQPQTSSQQSKGTKRKVSEDDWEIRHGSESDTFDQVGQDNPPVPKRQEKSRLR
ncbi:MAG: hypothetical protein Q9214_003619 [Letrouitia sp. 1 TL-2023]